MSARSKSRMGHLMAWCIIVFALLSVQLPVQVVSLESPPHITSLTITPEMTNQPRIGDAVTLSCQISQIRPVTIQFLKWNITHGFITLVDSNGTIPSQDGRISLRPLQLVQPSTHLYSQDVTISSIQETDQATYICKVTTNTNGTFNSSVILETFPSEAFPVCFPDGQASVASGSTLSCLSPVHADSIHITSPDGTSEISRWTRTQTSDMRIEFTTAAMAADNGSMFTCLALVGMQAAMTSCRIGPLVVLPSPDDEGGLTGSDIAGFVVGGVAILLLIAVHFLCCTPRRWRRTKSYLLDIGSRTIGTESRRRASRPSTAEVDDGNTLSEAPPRNS